MPLEPLLWAAAAAVAALAALAAAWWGRGRFVRGRRALLAVGVFLLVGGVAGFVVREPLLNELRQRRAQTRTEETFREVPLLRALAAAEPERAAELRQRLQHALENAPPEDIPQVEQRLLDEASRIALAAALARMGNATDEAAARLAEALLVALKTLHEKDAMLCLGLLHPADPLAESSLATLRGDARKRLDTGIALVLASAALKPSLSPSPARADAALSEMFSETLFDFASKYGKPKEVIALFEALSDTDAARKAAPDTLCYFAQDLLDALLRMPPEERGPGLRRVLGQ